MKKFGLVVSAVTLAIGLTACSGNNEEKTEKDSKVSKAEVKKAMVHFYMDLGKKINQTDVDLNAYEGAEKPDPKIKPQASESAAAVSEELKKIEIPAELKDQKASIEEALTDLANSYQAKADELKKDKPNLDAANETFAQGEGKLGKVFEDIGMGKTSIGVEVN